MNGSIADGLKYSPIIQQVHKKIIFKFLKLWFLKLKLSWHANSAREAQYYKSIQKLKPEENMADFCS